MDKRLFSDNPHEIAKALKGTIADDRSNSAKRDMETAQKYYSAEHEIMSNRIFYFDDNNSLVEDKYASNVKISHPFFTEQVDQKVQYLLSNDVSVTVEDDTFQTYLNEYWTDDMQLFLQEMIEGSSINGQEFAYATTDINDRLYFQTSSALNTIRVVDRVLKREVYLHYVDETNDKEKITKVMLANEKQFMHFVSGKNGEFKLDESIQPNPRYHVEAVQGDKRLTRSYSRIPFYQLDNNKLRTSDLKPIKDLIDDYDTMAVYMSNNLQDFNDVLYVVKGYEGEDLTRLKNNLTKKKVIGLSSDLGAGAGVDVKTFNIPVEARKTKMDIDKEAIYRFGMAFDSTQVGDGNITNVVIRSRYALLDMKANKAETRLKPMIAWINEMIVEDINRRYSTSYKARDIEVEIIRESVVDTKEIADIEQINATARELTIQSILAVQSYIDRESTIRLICEQFELDYDEVINRLDEEDYSPASRINENTDPLPPEVE